MRTQTKIRAGACIIGVVCLLVVWAILLRQPLTDFHPSAGVTLTLLLALALAVDLYLLFVTLDTERLYVLAQKPTEG